MRRRIAFSLMILALASSLVGGATLAFFTDKKEAPPTAFNAGTVMVKEGEVIVSETSQGKTVTWCLTNAGTKAAYFRVRIRGNNEYYSGSAGGAGTPYGKNNRPPWAMWFEYRLGSTAKTVQLLMGADMVPVGWVTVSSDKHNLYVEYNTFGGWTLRETHVYAEERIPTEKDTSPGQFRAQSGYLPDNTTSDLRVIPLSVFKGKTIYLVTHAVVEQGPAKWTLKPGSPWIAGGDWWYYQAPVPKGQTVCISLDVSGYGSTAEYYFEAEAVQSSNNAVAIWDGNPY